MKMQFILNIIFICYVLYSNHNNKVIVYLHNQNLGISLE